VLASWSERDYERTRIGGELAVYSLADSSVRSYLTRAVSAGEFELYRAEWEKWVGARARKRHVAER